MVRGRFWSRTCCLHPPRGDWFSNDQRPTPSSDAREIGRRNERKAGCSVPSPPIRKYHLCSEFSTEHHRGSPGRKIRQVPPSFRKGRKMPPPLGLRAKLTWKSSRGHTSPQRQRRPRHKPHSPDPSSHRLIPTQRSKKPPRSPLICLGRHGRPPFPGLKSEHETELINGH